MILKNLLASTALVAVTACSAVGPDFVKPRIDTASSFAFTNNQALRHAAQDEWWRSFKDPTLNRIMDRAMAQNLDLQIAQARIQEAEAALRAAGPAADLSGDVTAAGRATSTSGTTTTSVTGTFAPSFVIDLFGGRRRAQEQASANLMAAVYDKATTRLAMQLSVVQTYLDLRYFQTALAIQQRSVRSKNEFVSNVKIRRDAGDATDVEVRRAEAERDTTRAQIPVYVGGARVSLLALATLLAEPAQKLEAEVGSGRGQPGPSSNVNPGIPAELLRNRPDIRAAEARYAAATAAIGVQEAQLYPTLRLDGSVSAATVNTVTLGPTLILPLLTRGVRLARRDAARANAVEAEATWRKTVLSAVEEVQTALVRLQQADQQVAALRRAVITYRDTRRLSQEAFELNAVTVLDVLDTEDSLTSTELNLAAARRSFAQSWAQLNVGIGQGWMAEKPLVETVAVAKTTTAGG
jgi:multidrug efflux system outer membrane protein